MVGSFLAREELVRFVVLIEIVNLVRPTVEDFLGFLRRLTIEAQPVLLKGGKGGNELGCLRRLCSYKLFSAEEMVCTHTLYNEVWAGSLDLSVTELPEAMKRKQHKDSKPREHRKSFGTDISQRPEIAALRIEEGHWEGDTFSQVFKTITVDNGSEFSAFSQVENWGCAVYFAHPYTSWERPQNERHNGLFRTFVPKGVSIEAFSAEYILAAADELNGRPRKKLGYRTPEELFDEFLDSVYAAEGCGSIAQDGSQRLPS